MKVYPVSDSNLLPDNVDDSVNGIVQEWYADNSIVLYRLTNISQDLVDTWAELVLATINEWDKDKPYLAIHDLSKPGISLQYAALVNFDMMNIGITMGGRLDAEKIFDEYEQFTGRIAVNFNLSLSGQTNRTLMNYLNREHPNIRYKTFYNRSKSIRWLTGDYTDSSEFNVVGDS